MPIELNVIPVDDDDDLSNNYVVATDQGFYTPDDLNNLNFYLKHLNQAEREGASGTGLFSPFLRMNGDETLQGFNTSVAINNGTQNANNLDIDFSGDNTEDGSGHTVAFRLGDIPIVYLDLNEDGTAEAYYQINLDINENNNTQVSLEELQIYTSDSVALLSDYQLGGATDASDKGDAFLASDGFIKQFDLDSNGDVELTLNDDSAGQGGNDYYFFIPINNFADADPTDFFTLYSQFGPTPADDAGFAEWNTLLAAQINGVKFNDHDGDGTQDLGVDQVLAGFTVYIDHNNNNLLDIDEQYTQSDVNGEFIFYSLLGNTNYTIREVLSLDDLSAALKAVLSDAQEEALLPPDGVWDQTTDPADDGDQVVAVTNPSNEYFVAVGNHELQPDIAIDKTASVPDDCADVVDELVSYTISVTNDGEVDLDSVVVTDDFADAAPVYVSGDDNDGNALNGEVADGIMQVGETWVYSASHKVTQADIDGNGNYDSDEDGTNDVLRNVATVTAEAVGTDTEVTDNDEAFVDVCQDPALSIVKEAEVEGDCADVVGETITYTYTVDNTGNVALTDVEVTDSLPGVTAPSYVSGDVGDDGIMGVDETWTFTATRLVTQEDIDGNGVDSDGVADNDGDIDNIGYANAVAVATGAAAEEVSDEAFVDVCQDPALSIVKEAEVEGDCADVVGETITYTYTVDNTGNVALTDVEVTDSLPGVTAPSYVSGDVGDDGIMGVDETWTFTATRLVTQEDIDGNGVDSDGVADNDGDIDNIGYANAVAVATGAAAEEVSDEAFVDVCQDPALSIVKEAEVEGDCADVVGETITYTYTVDNTGNVALTDVEVTDSLPGVTAPSYVSGDVGDDGIMGVDETWTFTATRLVTQEDIDGNGVDSDGVADNDGDIDNIGYANAVAVATGAAAEEVSDEAFVDVCQDPALSIVKEAEVEGDCADVVGETITYTYTVDNTGNVALTDVEVTDSLPGVTAPSYVSGDVGDDGIMGVDETWTFTATRLVTQEDIDGNGVDSDGVADNDGDIDNIGYANAVAVATGAAAEEVSDEAFVDVCQDPAIDVEKTVKTDLNDYTDEDFDDDPDGLQASTSSKVTFRVVVTNTGNVTLANIALADSVVHTVNAIPGAPQDVVYTPDLNAATIDATDVFIDLNGNATLDDGEEWSNFDTDGDGTIDAGDAAELAPGETFTLYYSLDSQLGQHENTAEVTAAAATTGTVVIDADDANYFVLPSEDCVGVGTPGFWKNNGAAFWDGIANNEKHTGDPTVDGDSDPGFANGELLYAVDSDGVGGVDAFVDVNNDGVSDNAGLLIGDYNLNGLNDEGDAIFISLSDARMLIDASQKQLQDGKFMLGRDMVATWLNYLANGGPDGDCIGEASDTGSPRHYLDEAIDWMQTFGGLSGQNTNGGADTLTDNATGETFDTFFKGTLAVKTSASQWQSPVTDVAYDSAATLHGALDAYNNTGVIDETVYCCDRDDAAALLAISQIA